MATGLDGINLNRLVVFAAVAECSSITGAAARLGLGKAAISTQLAELEREVGVTLLVRNTKRLALTEAGEPPTPAGTAVLIPVADELAFSCASDGQCCVGGQRMRSAGVLAP